ncbi:protein STRICTOSIDINE SYNTHASE-LIKE 10-like [Silene latifolia]|uniref:protein STRICTOSIDINE SYNTHASE-LIKE 10-like n=1 Tax=Silene latifolia TaxID=37657 RepID=UPI003D7751F3
MATFQYIVSILLFVFLTSSYELVSVSDDSNTYVKIPLRTNQNGPEAIAFDCKGEGPYVGISDGRILKWQGEHISWTLFAVTAPNRSESCDGIFNSPMEKECGRPLGLRFDMKTCELYIADSSFGLMKVGCNGGVATSLATIAEGIPFALVNAFDIDSDNKLIYFSESSSAFHLWELKELTEAGDHSGRFMKYDMETGDVTVLLRNLSFANGVALSKKNDFVLVGESGTSQILKYWLTGYKAGTYEVLKYNGGPDNINRDAKGDFWVALLRTSKIKINHLGEILESLDANQIINCTDVSEVNNRLWFGFFFQNYIYHT